jgi:O-antigen ligase
VLLLSYLFQGQVLAVMDRDPTFTGRTEIWHLTWDAIQSRFWLGYGYGAFWAEPFGPATQIWDSLSWRVPNSHSGVLELWLGLGLIGLVLFCLFMVRACFMIASHARRAAPAETLWHVGLTLIFLTYSFSESASLEHNSIGWVMFMAVVAAVERPPERARSGRHAGRARSALQSGPREQERVPAFRASPRPMR